MQNLAKISIIIPVRNEQTLLPLCLNSLKQSISECHCKDFEIIVVLDNCTDSSERIASEHSCKTIKANLNNRSQARNLGFENSFGGKIIFIDADTVVSKFFIQEVLKFLELKDVVFCKQHELEESQLAKYYFRLLNLASRFIPVFSPVIACNRNYFIESGRFDDRLLALEDYKFLKKSFSEKQLIMSNSVVFTSIRRVEKYGLFFSIGLLLKSILNPYKYEWKPIN